jgi:hypothetical protein
LFGPPQLELFSSALINEATMADNPAHGKCKNIMGQENRGEVVMYTMHLCLPPTQWDKYQQY